MTHKISPKKITVSDFTSIYNENKKIELSEESIDLIKKGREYLDNKIKNSNDPIYGINTGFGSLYNISIDKDELGQLQKNLIISHACGVGDVIEKEVAKIILFFKIQSLSYGHSGISLEVVQRLVDMYNNDVIPIIYSQGSLGASGDLAPLAHLSLPLIGLGEVMYDGRRMNSKDVLSIMNWQPIELQSKEGLALLNGTQFILGHCVYIAMKTNRIKQRANEIASLSIDAYDGRIEPFDELIGKVRPHSGQINTSKFIKNQLEGSEIIKQKKQHVQDPYSLRCIPQVHGASEETLDYFINAIEIEMNSVTDNPNIFVEEDKIISAGNFHAQALALPLDFLSVALSEYANISERRIYLMLSGQRGLPLYLVANPGVNSGFMIAQYTAASIVSQNKQLATPASVDSIVSSNGQEDHVSMGANAATKCLKIVKNVEQVLGIEAMTAAQALEFRKPLKTSEKNLKLVESIRKEIPFIEQDTYMSPYLLKSKDILF